MPNGHQAHPLQRRVNARPPRKRPAHRRVTSSSGCGNACSPYCPLGSVAADRTPTTDGCSSKRLCIRCRRAVVGSTYHPSFLRSKPCTGSCDNGRKVGCGQKSGMAWSSLVHQDKYNCSTRWYNSGASTFTSRDQFEGFPERPYSQHPYNYALSNPTNFTDPTGRCASWVLGRFNPDPTCQYIGNERVLRGDLNWQDGLPWGGAAVDFTPGVGDVKGLIEAVSYTHLTLPTNREV